MRRKIETRLRRKYETHEEIGALKWSVVQLKKRRKECVLLVEKKKAKLQDICENVGTVLNVFFKKYPVIPEEYTSPSKLVNSTFIFEIIEIALLG